MNKPKNLAEFFEASDKTEEVYKTDQKIRIARSKKGVFGNSRHSFDFLFLIKKWDKIVGKMLAQNTIPQKIIKNTLIVITKHPTFAHELSLMSPLIIEKITQEIPELKDIIHKIKFSHSPFSAAEFSKQQERNQQHIAKTQNLHPFSPQYQNMRRRANELFNDIEDTELKELLTDLLLGIQK